MDLKLAGKKVLVSGSTAGIGYAIAKAYVNEGATTIVNGRTAKSVDAVVAELAALKKGKVAGFAGDLSQAEEAQRLKETHPEVDIIVNNLGIFEAVPFEDISDEEWQRFFDVNVISGVRLARHYLPYMKERNWGRILFISSESGIHIPEEMIHYGTTKAAQIAAARGLAEHLAGTGITVNSVLPGPTKSRGVQTFIEDTAKQRKISAQQFEKEFFQNMRPTSLIKRFAETDEVAALVCYLGSELASATTGAAMRVDGGVVKSAF